MSLQLVPGHVQLIWDELESCAVPSFLLLPLLYVPVAEVVVVVVVLGETSAERTLAVIIAGAEVVREPPHLVVPAVVGLLLHGVIALDTGTFVTSMAVLIHQTISKVAVYVTVFVIREVTIRVSSPKRKGFLLYGGLQVCVLEGGGEGAGVGGPWRHRAAVGVDSEDRNTRVGDGVTWAGSVLRPRREAWR